ncbi:Ankyrin repeat-containing domain [Fusarium agapanthi]|uniref:Ankyrin repeat-containing domain n=1 Tax=Fusarium agapanthi TaxID=1803897 RepID=A0A9P5E9C9_9HYPO|nr:Ankyrin repeat-containing domain [Fusarium agapanthi]
MDQVRKKDAIEAEWLRNYQLIRNLYLSDMSLNDVIYWLGILGNFTVTLKSQLEYRLKKWNIFKNIDRDSWKYIDQKINKRKLEGKESDVLLSGKRVKQSTIENETYRHRDKSIPAQILPESHVQSIALSHQLIICTPQAYLNEFEWPETLPWFKFRSNLQAWLSYTQLRKITSEQRGPVLNLLTSKILPVGDNFDQSQPSQLIPRLAMNLVMGMPEYFPGEHLHTAQIIATSTANVMIPECLKLIFYKVSNDMVSEWEADDFDNLYTILSRTGLLGAIDSLRRARQQDLTIRAFMDNLFKCLIMFIFSNKRMVNMEYPKTLVKWLLSLGQNPNLELRPFSIFKALEHAVLSRQVDIIEPLLKAGAVVGWNGHSSNPLSIISFVLPDRICDNEGAQIIRLLLDHYKALTSEEILHAAILLQDERLFEQALDIGANVSLPIETLTDHITCVKFNVVKKETALSTAAAVSLHATSVVFDLLQTRNQGIKAASFITPDVFISAACAGNADVISFLHKINPIGFRSGAVFPAEAILRLSSAGHDDILSAALDAGGDPNEQNLNGHSALALALQSKNTNCVQLLLERGAKPQTLTSELFEALLPKHVCNIHGERGGCDPRLRELLLEHWENIFDTNKDSVLDIDAAIIVQHDARLKRAFSELPTYYSPSSLCCAVLVENHWVIDFLLKNRSIQAPHNILEGTAVGLAAMLGDLPVVRKLVTQLQNPETALLPFKASSSSFLFYPTQGLAITLPHIFWHRRSIDYQDPDDPNSCRLSEGSPLALAISYRGTSGVLELLSHGYQPDDITWARAFSMNTLDCLEALMDYNLRVRCLQLPLLTLSPLLRYAIQHEMKEAVVWLIESGADINKNELLQYSGRSPVQFAIELDRLTIAESLLQFGAKVNAAPSFIAGVTALQSAAIKGHIGLAKQLLDAGARVNARGSRHQGRTALEGAAEWGRLDIVEVLLHYGALTTGNGRFQFIRAIYFAERGGYHATAALLRQSREWTDEDTHIYDSVCKACGDYFSEPRPSGRRCHACNGRYTPERYCCDEIHMPEDNCYHCYTEDEESRYRREILKEESELEENVQSKERMESAHVDRRDASSEDICLHYTYF